MTNLPAKSWDCHIHIFDPARFPFRKDRTYTPDPAPMDALIENTQFDCIVLVQASPEASEDGLLVQLREAKAKYPEKTFRASIITRSTPGHDIGQYSQESIDALHDLGVRSIRIQGNHGSFESNLDHVKTYLRCLAASYAVAQRGWSISLQMPLGIWAGLGHILSRNEDSSLGNAVLIAEHNASATPADIFSAEFRSFLDIMRTGRVYVKISALYRRSPDNFGRMRAIVRALADAAPERIVWGTDWPHVDPSRRGLEGSPPAHKVDWREELDAVRGWLSNEEFTKMLVMNPTRLYL